MFIGVIHTSPCRSVWHFHPVHSSRILPIEGDLCLGSCLLFTPGFPDPPQPRAFETAILPSNTLSTSERPKSLVIYCRHFLVHPPWQSRVFPWALQHQQVDLWQLSARAAVWGQLLPASWEESNCPAFPSPHLTAHTVVAENTVGSALHSHRAPVREHSVSAPPPAPPDRPSLLPSIPGQCLLCPSRQPRATGAPPQPQHRTGKVWRNDSNEQDRSHREKSGKEGVRPAPPGVTPELGAKPKGQAEGPCWLGTPLSSFKSSLPC